MQKFDFICRQLTATDDMGKVAEYIHLTDPYIYPAICENAEDKDWQLFICRCAEKQGNLFSRDNISVICHGNVIIGIACVIPCGKKLSIMDGIRIPPSLKDRLVSAVAGYFDPLIGESESFDGYNITNICIDEKYRGKGAGTKLMQYCIEKYGSQTLHLDVVASNKVAIALYEKFGFSIVSEYMGFSGCDMSLPCYHMIRINELI